MISPRNAHHHAEKLRRAHGVFDPVQCHDTGPTRRRRVAAQQFSSALRRNAAEVSTITIQRLEFARLGDMPVVHLPTFQRREVRGAVLGTVQAKAGVRPNDAHRRLSVFANQIDAATFLDLVASNVASVSGGVIA